MVSPHGSHSVRIHHQAMVGPIGTTRIADGPVLERHRGIVVEKRAAHSERLEQLIVGIFAQDLPVTRSMISPSRK